MKGIKLSNQYLTRMVTLIYRFGWLLAACAGTVRYVNGVIGLEFFSFYLALTVTSVAATFIPLSHFLYRRTQPTALLVPQCMVIASIIAQYYFNNPGMHIYNTATTVFLLLSGIWYLSQTSYYRLVGILALTHLVGLVNMTPPPAIHVFTLLFASAAPLVFFCVVIRNLLAHYQRLLAKQQSLNQEKDVFLSSVSHELRNPLQGILGSLASIQGKQHFDADKVATATYSAKQLQLIVEDILASERIVNGQMQLQCDWCALVHWRQDINSILQSISFKSDIEVSCLIQTDSKGVAPRDIYFDRRRVNQIVTNLLVNANKYTLSGNIDLAITVEHSQIVIKVDDTGVGMSEDTQAHIFEQFERAADADQVNTQGLGLGLFICKNYCDKMNGTFQVRSSVGVGSSFTFSVPIQTRESITASRIEDSYHAELSSVESPDEFSILVVDDCDINRSVVQTLLSDLVTDVYTASNGLEALTTIKNHPINLVFSDIHMPLMDGFDFAKALREVNHTVPCYALSGSITDVDEARLRMAGFDGTLAKPIDLEKVEGIINGLKKPEYQH